ncbi:MAG: PAS domain-containing protein [Vicinamibacterales bacterium]
MSGVGTASSGAADRQPRPSDEATGRQHLLWIGDPLPALRFAAEYPARMRVTACEVPALRGHLSAQAPGGPRFAGVVVDTTVQVDLPRVVATLDELGQDLPLLLIVAPEQRALLPASAEGESSDRVVKAPGFMHQVIPTLDQVRARRELLSAFRATTEREARLRSILDLQPAVALMVDPSGRIAAANRAGLQLMAHPDGGSVIGQLFVDFVLAAERDSVRTVLKGTSDTGSLEHALVRADGSRVRVLTRVTPFPQRDGLASLVTLDVRGSALDEPEVAAALVERSPSGDTAEPEDDEWEELPAEPASPEPAPELAEARSLLRQAAAERDAMAAERDRLALERDALSAERDALAVTQESLRAERDSLASERAELVASTARLSESLQEAEVQRQRDRAATERLAGERDQLRCERDAAIVEGQAARDAHVQATATASGSLAEAHGLASQLAALAAELAASRAALSSERTELEHVRERVARLDAERLELAAAVDAGAVQVMSVAEQLEAERVRAQALADQLDAERGQLASARDEAQTLRRQHLEAARGLDQLGPLQAERDHLALALDQATSDLQGLAADVVKLERLLASARTDCRVRDGALMTATRERDALTERVLAAEQETQHVRQQLAQVEAVVTTVSEERDRVVREHVDLASERDRLASGIDALRREQSHSTRDVSRLRQAADDALKERESTLTELATAIVERDRAVAALQDAVQARQQSLSELADARAEHEERRAALAEAVRERARLAAERDRLSRALRAVVSDDPAGETPAPAPPSDHERVAEEPSPIAAASGTAPPAPDVPLASNVDDTSAGVPPVKDGRERRRHHRITGTFDGERLGIMDTPVQIQNLSIGGCFVTSYLPPPQEARWDLRINLGRHGIAEVEVQTAYVSPEIGFGVQFVAMSDDARKRIAAVVEAARVATQPRGRTTAGKLGA